MANRLIDTYVLHPVEEEDHAQQKEDMVVSRDHVLGAEIQERHEMDAGNLLDVSLVAFRHSVGQRLARDRKGESD